MTERAFYSDTDDMLIDDDQRRELYRGMLTDRKLQTIELMHSRFGASLEAIASQLQLNLELVSKIVADLNSPKETDNPKPF